VTEHAGARVSDTIDAAAVLAFWRVVGPDKWYVKDAAFDAEVTSRFFDVWRAGAEGRLVQWEETPEGALALVIALDQFPRNMFRGDTRAYASDELARSVAARAIRRGFDLQVPQSERSFFYLPFMHSENLAEQERCLDLARGYGDDEFTKYAEQHAEIIRRFGRFPHRNAIVGRVSSAEEQAFLDAGGFAG
jgi:uncharacterized protein (DUF924 family)